MKTSLPAALFLFALSAEAAPEPPAARAPEGIAGQSAVPQASRPQVPGFPAPGAAAYAGPANTAKPAMAPKPASKASQAGPAGAPVLAATDEDFLAAREAFRIGDAAQIERLYPRFASSVLEPYVAYYRLHLHLDKADAASIKQFLARPADTPVIDRLRAEWLKQLGKNEQWDAFTGEYPHVVKEDAELLCYALQARRRVQEKEALVEARRLWFSGEAQPDDCIPLFDAALAAGIISESDVWQRIRMALESGNVDLVRQLAARLPSRRAFPATAVNQAYTNPGRYLSTVNLPKAGAAERMLTLFALRRLARQSPQLAYTRWEKMAAYFTEAEQRYFYGWLGYEASRSHDPRALAWYKEAADTQLTAAQLAWRARAAMRETDWREVLASINAMDPEQQREKAWRYWKGRALKALGFSVPAQALFAALSGEYGYYGLLAAEELDVMPVFAQIDSHSPDQKDIDKVLAQPGIQRALALYRLRADAEASREWAWAVRGYNDAQLLAAAVVAHRNGIYDRSIDAAERTQQLHDFNLRYPAPYRAELQEYVRSNDLDEAWVYGLMRQESRFAPHVNSNVGAAGLMQLMPETARWVAQKIGMKGYRAALLHELGINLKLGTYYLKTVSSQFDNNPVLASAAYNAGPNRAQQWCGDAALEGAIYIETIPFDETRDYVKKVMSNTVYYSRLFGQPPMPLKKRLGTIAPKDIARRSSSSNER